MLHQESLLLRRQRQGGQVLDEVLVKKRKVRLHGELVVFEGIGAAHCWIKAVLHLLEKHF